MENIQLNIGPIEDRQTVYLSAEATVADVESIYLDILRMSNGGSIPTGVKSYKNNQIVLNGDILSGGNYESLKNKTLQSLGINDGDDLCFNNKKGGNNISA